MSNMPTGFSQGKRIADGFNANKEANAQDFQRDVRPILVDEYAKLQATGHASPHIDFDTAMTQMLNHTRLENGLVRRDPETLLYPQLGDALKNGGQAGLIQQFVTTLAASNERQADRALGEPNISAVSSARQFVEEGNRGVFSRLSERFSALASTDPRATQEEIRANFINKLALDVNLSNYRAAGETAQKLAGVTPSDIGHYATHGHLPGTIMPDQVAAYLNPQAAPGVKPTAGM